MAIAVLRSMAEWTARFGAAPRRSIVAIGNFDGIHLGHQKILKEVVERARSSGSLSAAITFDPHPLHVLRPADAPALISTLGQRIALMDRLGLDAVLVLKFDLELSRLSPEEFVQKILVEGLHISAVLVGDNFRFGHRHAGDTRLLAELGRRFSFTVETITPVEFRGKVISSSGIRQAIREGRVALAARWLGRPFALGGEVRSGTGQGRQVVVPTLNLETTQELLPRTGVYATETRVDGTVYRSATNVGYRPTFDGKRLTIESHLFDFSRDVTAGPIEVRFCVRLRDEQKVPTIDALRGQVTRDLQRTRKFFQRADRLLGSRQTV
ncbi:MAG: bifunctional riboflavin kinase/FAD synthetase [Candidatus Acidiferrales bacterium]